MKLRPRSVVAPDRLGSRHTPARAAKSKAATFNVADWDSDSSQDGLSHEDEDGDNIDLSPPAPRPITTPRVTRSARTRSQVQVPSAKRRRNIRLSRPVARSPRTRTQATAQDQSIPDSSDVPNGTIPDWASLPYAILVSIFKFVSQPVDSSWLVDVACLCQAFAEPALTALYRSPPIANPQKAYQLVELLRRSSTGQETTRYNYRHKIKSLSLDVGAVVGPVYRGAALDLATLFQNIPSVVDVKIFHQKDLPPYRQLSDNIRWVYRDSLLEGLGVKGNDGPRLRLRSWEWNSRFLRKMSLAQVRDLHHTSPFKFLRKIHFVNFQSPSFTSSHRKLRDKIDEEIMDRNFAAEMAECIVALPDLDHLVFESSTCINGLLLPALPQNLKVLELLNCWEIRSDELGLFLQSHGQNLEVLNLHHNQALNLSFLTLLGEVCPKLRELRVNLNYFRISELETSDPCYDHLLTVHEVPNWPSTLEVIDISNMRQWESDTAEMFFKSLADSAIKLPMLRQLVIKARLTSVSWRERSLLRDLWVDKLEKIYLRPWNPPAKYRSLRDFKPSIASTDNPQKGPQEQQEQKEQQTLVAGRRSTRFADSDSTSRHASKFARTVSYKETDTDEDEFDSDINISRKRQKRGLEQDSDSDSSELSDISDLDVLALDIHHHEAKQYFIQGMCDVVDIRIDNQKPVEMPFGMDDFMDESEGGESEWDGRDPDDMPGYAW